MLLKRVVYYMHPSSVNYYVILSHRVECNLTLHKFLIIVLDALISVGLLDSTD